MLEELKKENINANFHELKNKIMNEFIFWAESKYDSEKQSLQVISNIERNINSNTEDLSERLPDTVSFTNNFNQETFCTLFRFPPEFEVTKENINELKTSTIKIFMEKTAGLEFTSTLLHKDIEYEVKTEKNPESNDVQIKLQLKSK